MEIFLGLLGLIVMAIILVAIKKRKLINDMITAQSEVRTAKKQLETAMYEVEYQEQLPDAIKEKVAKDLDKKFVNKKSFGEKFKELNDSLAKSQQNNNRPGLQSIMDDMNVFAQPKPQVSKKQQGSTFVNQGNSDIFSDLSRLGQSQNSIFSDLDITRKHKAVSKSKKKQSKKKQTKKAKKKGKKKGNKR